MQGKAAGKSARQLVRQLGRQLGRRGEAEKDCKVVESAMATGMGFRKSLHVSPWQKNWVWLSGDDLDLEREHNSMRLESVFMQVKSRYISDNHASRALRCFKKNCACCHWSRGLKVTFGVRSSAKKGGWQGLCRGSRIVQGNWKYSGGGQDFSAGLSVSTPLGLECEFLQGLSKILLSLAPKRKPKQLQHSPLEQV